MTLHDRILSLLALSPCSTGQVARRLAVSQRRAREALQRLERTHQVRQHDDHLWRLRTRTHRTEAAMARDLDVLQAVEDLGAPIAAEVVDWTGRARSSVYQSLESLRFLGLVVQLRPVQRSVRWRVR